MQAIGRVVGHFVQADAAGGPRVGALGASGDVSDVRAGAPTHADNVTRRITEIGMRIGVFELRNEYLFGRPVADVIWAAFATSNPTRDKSVQMSSDTGETAHVALHACSP